MTCHSEDNNLEVITTAVSGKRTGPQTEPETRHRNGVPREERRFAV